ncbi:MAG: porin family protein [Paludibacter sp.]|jgi:hypothetical protein|nr:porin family protein [Paludibacter sp.]
MRNLILVIMLIFISATYAQSSDNKAETGKFLLGANISPTISWIDTEHNDLQTDGATITGGVGFVAEYKASRLFSLVSGLNFILPGGYVFDSLSLADQSTKNNFRVNFPSLEVPVLIRINSIPFEKTTYYAQGGLTTSYRFSATESYRASSFQTSDRHIDITPLINPIQLNFQIGFGAKFRVLRLFRLFAEVNYKNSIVNLASETGYMMAPLRYSAANPVPDIRNGNMVFSVGVLF